MTLQDRRRHSRATLPSTVSLLLGSQPVGAYEVLNLSAGGLLLSGDPPAGPDTAVELVLAVTSGPAPPRSLRTGGVVRRVQETAHGPAFAVTFSDLDGESRGEIEGLVSACLEQARAAAVLVVDDSREIGVALSSQLRRLGHSAHAVTTPLAAVRLLSQNNRVTVAIVDLVLGAADGLDLMAYLADQHPQVRRVLMSGHAQPAQLALAMRKDGGRAAHEVLAKPWTERALARALGG